MPAGLLAVALFLLLPASALHAHPANVGTADIAVGERRVEIAISVNLFELDLLLSLDQNLDATVALEELEARRSEIVAYLARTVAVAADGVELPLSVGAFRIGRGGDGKALFETTLRFDAERPLGPFTIRCEPLTELGRDHTMLARIQVAGRTDQFAFRQGSVYASAPRPLAHALEFLKLGVLHIFTGWDHLAFLIGLLVTGGRLPAIVKIVTAFTVAHSVTLSLAALGAVTLPPGLVEAGIALSIVYVALENLFWRNHDRRWLVSFLFGLVHGFGFAAVLRELHLPRSGLAASLFSFNLGVEVGQVAVVLLVIPLLWWSARSPLHAAMTRSISAVLLSLGLFWLYQRVL
jgi:hydrogenase/urease accessory protein HupE